MATTVWAVSCVSILRVRDTHKTLPSVGGPTISKSLVPWFFVNLINLINTGLRAVKWGVLEGHGVRWICIECHCFNALAEMV